MHRIDTIEDLVGNLKGARAEEAAIKEAYSIAREMGLLLTKPLSDAHLWELTERSDTDGIAAGDLRSFRRADLIMEATDADGNVCYIAVEVSYTANGRDTTRARRNAEFLTRFTGRPAHAVVAGVRQDNRIRDVVASGAVYWYQLSEPG